MPSRFLAKGRGVIGLPLQQPLVATRVTRFQRFCLFACQLKLGRCVLRRRIAIAAGPTGDAAADRSRDRCHVEHEKKTFFS